MSARDALRRFVGPEDALLVVAGVFLLVAIRTGAMFAAWAAIGLSVAELVVVAWWLAGVGAGASVGGGKR